MALLNANQLTLVDVARRLKPDGSVETDIAELLSQTNAILKDGVFVEANEKTAHRVTIRTGLPTVYYRALNQGTPSSKSTTAQVKEGISLLEGRATMDLKELQISADPSALMMTESEPFLEAMNQRQAADTFYGNPSVDQRQYLGFAGRYSTKVGATNGQNILDAGGILTNNTSIWLVGWGPSTVFYTYPPGTQAGLQQRTLGEQRVLDSLGNAYQAMEVLYQWDNGLVVKDWRYAIRIANINTANLVAETSAADLMKLMSRAIDRIPAMGKCSPVFYGNRTVMSMLKIQALNKSQNAIAVQPALSQLGNVTPGQFEYSFLGVPLRLVDQILNTEAQVV